MANYFDSEPDFDVLSFAKPADVVAQAAQEIIESGLDKMRCALTGAPYATIDSNTIRATLRAELAANPGTPAGRLVDLWSLRMLPYGTRACPTMLGNSEFNLSSVLTGYEDGAIRVISYLVTAFFFPAAKNSTRAIARMVFSGAVYDALADLTAEGDKRVAYDLARFVQRLSAADSWCKLSEWTRFQTFFAPRAVAGIYAKGNEAVAGWVKDPDSFEVSIASLELLTGFMLAFMVHSTMQEHELPASGRGNSKRVFEEITSSISLLAMPADRVSPMSTALLDIAGLSSNILERQSSAVKIAHSATYGKGVPMRGAMPVSRKAKAAKESGASGLPKVKAKASASVESLTDRQKAARAKKNAFAAVLGLNTKPFSN